MTGTHLLDFRGEVAGQFFELRGIMFVGFKSPTAAR
jgi:hypothetical protein